MSIPKTIHYCWFGGKEIPVEYQEYITEWQSLHEGWEIKRWDESNIPTDIPYVQNALAHSKWANLSNYIRFYVIMNQGGIYMDTDVKVIKPLDSLLENECFFGFEEGAEGSTEFWVNNAIMGATKNNPFITACATYLLSTFDGLEEANLSAPQLVTKLLRETCGLNTYGLQTVNGVTVYPSTYFYPIHYSEMHKFADLWNNIDETTMAVHIWSRSWLTQAQLLIMYDDLQFKYFKQQDQEGNFNALVKAKTEEFQNKEAILNERIDFLIANELLLQKIIAEKDTQIIQQAFFDNIKAELLKSQQLLEQHATNIAELRLLEKRVHEYEKQINWYQLTYEKRSLWGIIKDRIIKFLNLKHG